MVSLRIGSKPVAWMILGVAALLLTLGALWALLALGPGRLSTAGAYQDAAAGNQFALPAGLISQTRFPPIHPGAVNFPPGMEGGSGDNLLVLALSSMAFLFLATLPLLMRRKARHVAKPGRPYSANLVDQSLPVASSAVS